MKVNFEITENYALNFQGRQIDLHNNFELLGFDYKAAEKIFLMYWQKSAGKWVGAEELEKITLIHKKVNYLNISSETHFHTNLLGLTFFPSVQRNIANELMLQSTPQLGDDILYFFEGEGSIRIGCEEIELGVG